MLLGGVLRVAGSRVCARFWCWLVVVLAGCKYSRGDAPQAPPIGVLEPSDGQRPADVPPVLEGPDRGQLAAAGAPLFDLAVDAAGQPEAGCWTRALR